MRKSGAVARALFACAPVLSLCAAAQAQSFPTRQVTIIVPFAAGGPSDAMARLIAQGLSEKIGARVIVENIAGAGGTVGSAPCARGARD